MSSDGHGGMAGGMAAFFVLLEFLGSTTPQKKKDITEEQEPRRTPPLFLEPGDVNDSYRSSDSSPVL